MRLSHWAGDLGKRSRLPGEEWGGNPKKEEATSGKPLSLLQTLSCPWLMADLNTCEVRCP